MSNSRIFCITFVVASGAMATAKMLGIESRYTGIEEMIGQLIVCATFGFASVAILGDKGGQA